MSLRTLLLIGGGLLGALALGGAVWLFSGGGAALTSGALELARGKLEAAGVEGAAFEDLRAQVDATILAVREGRLDGASARAALKAVGAALADGELTPGEVDDLRARLRGLTASEATPDPAPA